MTPVATIQSAPRCEIQVAMRPLALRPPAAQGPAWPERPNAPSCWRSKELREWRQAIEIGASPEGVQSLALKRANRHGLIAGATGTGKTVTLQVLAEAFAREGVNVFAADIKGDLSGCAAVSDPPPGWATARADRDQHAARRPKRRRPCSGTSMANSATRCAPPSPKWARC